MSAPLIIWLPQDIRQTWHWYVSPELSGQAQSEAEKADLASVDTKSVYVILPGQWVRMFALDLPKMRSSDLKNAAGFSIEDKIAAPVGRQHIAISSQDGQTRAGVIASEKMQAVKKALSAAGVSATQIFADFDVLRPQGSIYRLADRVIVAGEDGFTTDPDLYGALGGSPELPTAQASAAQLSRSLYFDSGVNFAQGKFSGRTFQIGNIKSLWRVAALFVGLAVVGLGWSGVNARAVNLQSSSLAEQMRETYEVATGQSAPSNPALTVTRAIKSGGPVQADFLSLSALLFEAVSRVDAVVVDTLQYDQTQNRLNLRLIYPSFESASEIEVAVAALGGEFRAGGVREQAGRKIGDAVLTLGGTP